MIRNRVIFSVTLVALGLALHLYAQPLSSQQRWNPQEIDAAAHMGAGAGSSGVSGIRTIVLKGDATKPGVYMIRLIVPAHTSIMPHEHPDDRVATVVAGTWFFGYGDRFDAKALKALPAGSFYTEPPRQAHFARTGDSAVIVDIAGYGPTGTRYERAGDAPGSGSQAQRDQAWSQDVAAGLPRVVPRSAIAKEVQP
jgi:hypothetical protein